MKNYLDRNCRNYDLFEGEDPFFHAFFNTLSKDEKFMRSDIKELKDSYVIEIEVPGISKDDIKIALENKYLTISVATEKEKESEHVHYISQERHSGSYSRSYYVGDIKQESIKASFKDGLLIISIPKEEYKKEEERKYISIE